MTREIHNLVRNSDSEVLGTLSIEAGETLPAAGSGRQWVMHSVERYVARVRDSDDQVIGLWSGRGVLPTAESGTTNYEIDGATYATLSSGFRSRAQPQRRRPNGTYQQDADTRPYLRFTAPGPDPRRLRLAKGDASANIQVVDLDTSTGNPTTFNGTRVITIGRHLLRLDFTDGIALWAVPTSRAMRLEITEDDDFRSEQGIRIQVLATDASDLAP